MEEAVLVSALRLDCPRERTTERAKCDVFRRHDCTAPTATTNKLFSHRRPDFSLALLRPQEGQPPNLATFKVPLRFNKFDFRDYLWNCYGVEVNGVRSFINQMRARQRSFYGSRGKWYRPRSVKMMIADLKQPFVWPDPPKDLGPWDNKMYMAVEKGSDEQNKAAEHRSKYGPQRVRSRGEAGPSRADLARAARLLAYGLGKWKPQAETAKRIGTPQFVRDAKKPGDEK